MTLDQDIARMLGVVPPAKSSTVVAHCDSALEAAGFYYRSRVEPKPQPVHEYKVYVSRSEYGKYYTQGPPGAALYDLDWASEGADYYDSGDESRDDFEDEGETDASCSARDDWDAHYGDTYDPDSGAPICVDCTEVNHHLNDQWRCVNCAGHPGL